MNIRNTYKELKLKFLISSYPIPTLILEIPIRNWNLSGGANTDKVTDILEIPIRNWNTFV